MPGSRICAAASGAGGNSVAPTSRSAPIASVQSSFAAVIELAEASHATVTTPPVVGSVIATTPARSRASGSP